MDTVIEALREVLGTPDFYNVIPGQQNQYPQWDYGAMFEYLVASLLLIIVVGSVFKILVNLFKRG